MPLGGELQPAVGGVEMNVFLGHSGKLDENQHVVVLFVNVDQRFANVFAGGPIGGGRANVAKKLDFQFRLPPFAGAVLTWIP